MVGFEKHLGVATRSGRLGEQDRDVVRCVIEQDEYKLCIRPCRKEGDRVIDVGAHIGSFSVAWHNKNPNSEFICIEACNDNIPLLQENVGSFAKVVEAACGKFASPVKLFNSIVHNGTATGGSMVVPADRRLDSDLYRDDGKVLATVEIDDVFSESGWEYIDVLKLDCEGGEFSILENCQCLDKVRFICGEYHGRHKWERLLSNLFTEWGYAHIYTSGDLGIFHLQNPRFSEMC